MSDETDRIREEAMADLQQAEGSGGATVVDFYKAQESMEVLLSTIEQQRLVLDLDEVRAIISLRARVTEAEHEAEDIQTELDDVATLLKLKNDGPFIPSKVVGDVRSAVQKRLNLVDQSISEFWRSVAGEPTIVDLFNEIEAKITEAGDGPEADHLRWVLSLFPELKELEAKDLAP